MTFTKELHFNGRGTLKNDILLLPWLCLSLVNIDFRDLMCTLAAGIFAFHELNISENEHNRNDFEALFAWQ